MVDFIKTVDGSRIPYSEIAEIEERGLGKSTIKTKNRKKYVVRGYAPELASSIEDKTAHVISAHPGYSVIFTEPPKCKNGEWKTIKLQVIGWRLVQSMCERGRILESVPVIAGVYTLPDFWALELPDGKVAPSDRDLPMSIEEWLESLAKSLDEDGYYQDDDDDSDKDVISNEEINEFIDEMNCG